MKKQVFFNALSAGLVWLAMFTLSLNLSAQHTHPVKANPLEDETLHICQFDHEDESGAQRHKNDAPPSWVTIETPQITAGMPSFQVAFEPVENNQFLYENVAGWLGGEAVKAQVSIRNSIKNIGQSNIVLNKIVYTYTQNGITVNRQFTLNPAEVIAPNAWFNWQNSRDYHEAGDVLYFNSPIPNALTIKFYFDGSNIPYEFTKGLAAYTPNFGMPFRAFDLKSNEVWQGGSTHGGPSQVFAYDLSVQGLENGTWTYSLPGTDGTQNSHARCWGKPIYAIADGVVESFENTHADNPAPGIKNGLGGNGFKIIHGTHRATYWHMQMGSLNDNLMQVGAVVKKGDFLGLVGNSGNSTGPHLHYHIVKMVNGEALTPCRPAHFNTGWVIQKTSFNSLSNSANWFKLTNHGLPGYAGTRAFIWPSEAKPQYNDNVYTSVYREGTGGYALWTNETSAGIVAKDNAYKALGLRMTDLNVVKEGNNLKYSGVWRAGSGASTLQTGTTWASFTSQWSSLGGNGQRLLDIEVYKDANGNLRYAGVYGVGNWGQALYAGKTQSEFNALWSSLGNQGYRLVDVEVYNSGGQTYYAGVWKTGSGGYGLYHANSWSSFTDTWDDLADQGYRLVDMDTDKTGSNTIYSGTFLPGNDSYYLWQNNYNSTISKWEHLSERGLRLIDFNIRPSSGSTTPEVPGDDDIAEMQVSEDRESGSDGAVEEILLLGSERSEGRFAENSAADFDLSVFPNPVSDALTVVADAEILGWTVSNTLGQTLLSNSDEGTEKRAVIQVSNLKTGVYSMTVRTAEGVRTEQFEVVR